MSGEIDYCSLAMELRQVRVAMLSGKMVTQTHFGTEGARFAKPPSMAELNSAIADADRQCAIQCGLSPKRTRYAISGRARPY